MGIALIIVGGLVLMTGFATAFDYLGKRKNKAGSELEKKVGLLEQRLATVEAKVAEKDDRISQLQDEVAFVNKLIENKSP